MAISEGVSLLGRIERLGEASKAEAARLIARIYEDGVVTRPEAEALFDLNQRLTGEDRVWDARFIEAICDFLLTREAPEGWITDEEADWLINRIRPDRGVCSETDIDLLLVLLRRAEGAPIRLSRFTLGAVSARICHRARADSEDVERMRRAIYASSGEGRTAVTRHEANILFATNDSVAFARNAPEWSSLFARAVANHLLSAAHPAPDTIEEAFDREAWLKDTSSDMGDVLARLTRRISEGSWFERVMYDPKKAARAREAAREAAAKAGAEVSDGEGDWLMRRLGFDKSISPAERALITFLREEAPGFVNGLAAR
ncbi:MAG: hypothetical protein GVY06_11205 [Alphaproteobacteria bacterium]|jgi:hypothetical protein|nr:hypothetical protein [Alphaproteobacteria bacterium]